MFDSFHIHPTVSWPFSLRGFRRTKSKPAMGFVCSTQMKDPGHRSPALHRSKPSHMWRRFILAHLPLKTGTAGREAEDTAMVLPSSASTSYGPWQRKPCCLSKVALLPAWIMTARETPAELAAGAEVSLSSNPKCSAPWYVSWCHLQRRKHAGCFYLHGSNLRVHSKSSLRNFRVSNSFSSYMCVHVLNPFLPSIPMICAYWCHCTDAG